MDLPKEEHKILAFWKEKKIFSKLRDKNKKGPRWSFLDGPITANNPMGVHHAWGRTLKDLFQRYHAMRGYNLRYQNGFDCQGLWVEVGVEKDLGFKNKKDIEDYGIDKFVEKCKERVNKYAKIQTEQSERLGYWMDWDNSYYTMSDGNNYTIWHFLKKVWQSGDLYKGRDSVPWCPRCGTAISQHEVVTEGYKELTHEAVFFKLPIQGKENEYFLVWTTTPWTLPANVALAVNPEFTYLKAKNKEGEIFYFVSMKDELGGDSLAARTPMEEKFGLEVVEKIKGKDLEGWKYKGPFDSLPRVQAAAKEKSEKFHCVIGDKELVTASEGTGIVHIAPGCGTEDFAIGKKESLPVIDVINEEAIYLEDMGEFSGKNAKDNPAIILDFLKHEEDGLFFVTTENYSHRYPTCWRCKTELVWRVVDEWYIAMDELRQRMIEVTKKIKWIPSFGLDRELDWLKNMHDWLISKKRYWGLSLPIWECECGYFEVIGSKEELKEKAVEGWDDFDGHSPHRPWIDAVKIKCPKCGKTVSRIPDVGNPWLDAGIVPFSTLVDPETDKVSYLDDKTYWQQWFPADFVTECFPGQFRNWFYSLIAMATVLEDKNPFKVLLGHSLVKDEKGEEMHKSAGNAIWFEDGAEKMGVDVMRWMYTSSNPTIDLKFGYKAGDEVRRGVFIPLLNVVTFYQMFSEGLEVEDMKEDDLANVLDSWVRSKLNVLIKEVTERLEEFDPTAASRAIGEFITELSVWYIRRSRNRFKGENQEEKLRALRTLRNVIFNLVRLMAPFVPFITEHIYREMNGREESVHLESWPIDKARKIDHIDQKVLDFMATTRQVIELGLAKRAELGIKVRQPLQRLSVFSPSADSGQGPQLSNEYIELIKDELNVKDVSFNQADSGVMKVELDTTITPELKEEGHVRELVRAINNIRKKMGLTIKDRVEIQYQTDNEALAAVFQKFEKGLLEQTLATKIVKKDSGLEALEINGVEVGLRVTKL